MNEIFQDLRKTKNHIRDLLKREQFSEAKAICDRLSPASAIDAEIWYLLARAHHHTHHHLEAAKYAMKALGLDSSFDDAQYIYALSLLNISQYEKAIQHLHILIKHTPDYPGAQALAGKVLYRMNMLNEALEHLNEATQQDATDIETLETIAMIQERTRQINLCQQTLDLMERIDSKHPGLLLTRARLDKRTGKLAESRQSLELLCQMPTPDSYKAQAACELGHVLDKMGSYEDAYTKFQYTNELMEKAHDKSYGTRYYYDRIMNLKTTFTPEFVAKWPRKNRADKSSPPIFLVSFPRSGTTLTEKIISTHSQIIPSDEITIITTLIKQLVDQGFKYPHDIDKLTKIQLTELRRRYWDRAQTTIGGKFRGRRFLDKLPLNIIDLGFIYRLFPEAPIIFVLRDPRDVCLSCFMQLFALNPATIQFTNIDNTARFYAATMDLWLHYCKILKLKRHVIRYENIVSNMENEAHKLIKFLGLPWEQDMLQYHNKQGKGSATTPSYQDVNKPIYNRAMGRWHNYEPHMTTALTILRPFLDEFKYD